jgi:alkylation response protein AidB-like acyl-CoA dehydrogenase
MAQAGQLGFLAVEVPEKFGGAALTLIESALVFEAFAQSGNGSVLVTLGAGNNGIGMAPLLFFGNDAQRAKYLPKLVSGEWIAAYALTEPGSGSDALAAKTRAELTPDGKHYRVNGTKRFISNAAFADLFTVFVKIDGQNACLLIERATPGLTIGPEENKLGLRGSSTCDLILEDALVPVENVLGAIGKGHKIVFNTLNIGRFKLGAGAVGGLKGGVAPVVQYLSERKQFGEPLTTFDETRAKLADSVIAGWVGESLVYRTAGLLSNELHGKQFGNAAALAIEEYDLECSLVKVALSEMLHDAVDNAIQLYGGYGFLEDYPPARAWRDQRVNRIFEGTNEVNRMLAVKELGKRAAKGTLDLIGAYGQAAEFVRAATSDVAPPQSLAAKAKEKLFVGAAAARKAAKTRRVSVGLQTLAKELRALFTSERGATSHGPDLRQALLAAKQTAIFAIGTAVQELMMGLEKKQQVIMQMADLLIWSYALDSAVLRLEKLQASGKNAGLANDVAHAYFAKTLPKIAEAASRVLMAVGKGDDAKRCSALLSRHYLKPEFELTALRQRIGAAVVEVKRYPF